MKNDFKTSKHCETQFINVFHYNLIMYFLMKALLPSHCSLFANIYIAEFAIQFLSAFLFLSREHINFNWNHRFLKSAHMDTK